MVADSDILGLESVSSPCLLVHADRLKTSGLLMSRSMDESNT